MSEAQRKLKDRIRRLRELTADRGCTEAEAMSAAEKAAQLMRDHGLSDADIVMDEQASSTRQKGGGQKARLWPIIAYCTNTSIIVLTARDTQVAFIGREPGPEIAVYLRDVCERAVDRELRRFKQSKLYRRQRKASSRRDTAAAFVLGMVARLCSRLEKAFGPTISADARNEAKHALMQRYSGSVTLDKPKAPLGRWDAAAAGFVAAENVTLAHGVGGAAMPLQIGVAS